MTEPNTTTERSGQRADSRWSRFLEAAKKSGPGWMMTAYTLGSGSAVGSLWAGAKFGYDLLWVQPASMLMGVIVLAGAAYVAIRNEETPYRLFWQLSPVLALSWGLTSLFASIIWHFPQYGLVYEAVRELLGSPNVVWLQAAVGLVVAALAITLTWGYAKGSRGLTIYETIMKSMVWLTVLCLGVVLLKVPVDWGAVLGGLFSFRHPEGSRPIIFGLLGAAVGINMTFLYPYSVRSKGWNDEAEGTRTAYVDLLKGMFLPYAIATGMLVVASAATLHAQGVELDKSRITEMATIFQSAFGGRVGGILFNLGILAMPLSSITLHMLTTGFVLSEMRGRPLYGATWKVGTLLPVVGALGVAVPLRGWLPVAASAICMIFLPIAYLGFILLFARQVRQEAAAGRKTPRYLLAPMTLVLTVVTVLAGVKTFVAVTKLFLGG